MHRKKSDATEVPKKQNGRGGKNQYNREESRYLRGKIIN